MAVESKPLEGLVRSPGFLQGFGSKVYSAVGVSSHTIPYAQDCAIEYSRSTHIEYMLSIRSHIHNMHLCMVACVVACMYVVMLTYKYNTYRHI